MLMKFLNYRGDGYIVINTSYLIAVEEIKNGSIFYVDAIENKPTPEFKNGSLTKKVFTSESVEEITEKLGLGDGEVVNTRKTATYNSDNDMPF